MISSFEESGKIKQPVQGFGEALEKLFCPNSEIVPSLLPIQTGRRVSQLTTGVFNLG